MSVDETIQKFIQTITYLAGNSEVISVPTDYESRVKLCQEILDNDITGLIATTVEFMLNAVEEVSFRIETDNPTLTNVLNKWLQWINRDLNTEISSGFNAFQVEFCSEYVTSSMSLVRYNMENFTVGENNIIVPKNLWVLNSKNVKIKGDANKLADFSYTIDNTPIRKPYFIRKDGRWYNPYPSPFLVRRGVANNYLLKQKIKKESANILKQLLWYLFVLKKGHPQLPEAVYSDTDYTNIANNLETELQANHDSIEHKKIPSYVTGFDTDFEHLIPDLGKIFDKKLYEEIDRDILAGLGLIEVMEGIGSTRQESMLNPKPLIQFTVKLILQVEKLLYDLIYEIVKENIQSHRKLFSSTNKIRIVATPLKAFWTEEFKTFVRSFYDRGLVSKETALESIGFDFETELKRREKELADGIDIIMYPQIVQNNEKDESGLEALRIPKQEELNQKETDQEENITEDKEGVEKENFTQSSEFVCECLKCGNIINSDSHCKDIKCSKCGGEMRRKERPSTLDSDLEGAPIKNIKDLPKAVKNSMTEDLQGVWLRTFNNAYDYYDNLEDKARDVIASKVAWNVIKRIARKNKEGLWIRKRKRQDGKLATIQVTMPMIDKALATAEKEIIDDIKERKGLVMSSKREKLIDYLLLQAQKEQDEDI